MYFLNLAPFGKNKNISEKSQKRDGRRRQDEAQTFLQAGEAEQLHQAEVVSGDEHRSGVVGVHSVDGCWVRVFRPDAVDLGAQDAAPGGPELIFHLLLTDRFPHCRSKTTNFSKTPLQDFVYV